MRYPTLFPPVRDDETAETCTIAGTTMRLDSVAFERVPAAAIPDAIWVDGGSATLFSTPSRAIALLKICELHTKGLTRSAQAIHTYLCSVTADGDTFLVRAHALSEQDPRIDDALARDISRNLLPDDATPAMVVDIVRTIAEHSIRADTIVIHDGSVRTTNNYLRTQLTDVPGIAKTTGLLTSRSRPLGLALLTRAPPGTWTASVCDGVSLVRLHPRASHIFLVEQPTPELLALYAAWSEDAAFPGYPYPLVLADQLARVTNNERDAWRTILATDDDAMRIVRGELSASDAHDVLEHILYGKQTF